ncbi:hypothetical protein QRD40_10970 [Comamonas sp. Y6]|uniref:DUF2116 family Zn-ribbon domain-containing protein n=1 Tax=Comamonas resistens TaxID=3046670 RepID=A0ABY8SW20_9BURK|nr:hypothetical protein [Comamonas resistens]MDL5036868.1 hypothetical protein [Comamonas resistens]WHS67178.1 hypothetical protein QMY55_08685 [Comamonas resistens]
MTAEYHPNICTECGKPIILGARAKTCSEKCRRARLRKQKRLLYEKNRGTDHFKAQQAKAVARRKERRATDPEFDAQAAEAGKKAVIKAVAKRNADPDRRADQLKKMRDWKASASEEQKEKMREANRRWYAELSPEAKAALIAEKSEKRRQRNAAKKAQEPQRA